MLSQIIVKKHSIQQLKLILPKFSNQFTNYFFQQSITNSKSDLKTNLKITKYVQENLFLTKPKNLNVRYFSSMQTPPKEQNEEEALKKYTKDLTELAKKGKLDPVVGRDEEIRRTTQILSRRTKNNPILIGEPGVGKTAIVEGLAQRIVAGEVPSSLLNKKVLLLDLGLLVAGAKYRGEFEERLKTLLKAIEKHQDLIIFIDEIHNLVGAGKAEGSMDASNLVKPQLSRGELHCIGATTLDEFRIHIEKDAALARRFQPLYVKEPTVEETVSILRGLKEKYEVHHGVRILDSAIIAAATKAKKHITQRHLPDSAIDLIDESAARLSLQQQSKPENLENLERLITRLKIEFESLKNEHDPISLDRRKQIQQELEQNKKEFDKLNQDFLKEKEELSKINSIKKQLEQLRIELEIAIRKGDHSNAARIKHGSIPQLEKQIPKESIQNEDSYHSNKLLRDFVTDQDICHVVSRITGIPLENLVAGEKERLLKMEHMLQKRVKGQDHAIKIVSQAVRLNRAGLHPHKGPIGCFMFVGPSGVGKTELAKALAEFLFDDENAMIRIDMSEFMERFSVSRLIGAPPGYVGYEEGGKLTEAVRRRPFSVVLLDEFEKAHPEVSNLLLQVLGEGHLTDSHGRKVDFKSTIIVLTSNIGSNIIGSLDENKSISSVKDDIISAMKRHFAPEFMNRLDDIIFFERLSLETMKKILDLEISSINKIFEERNIQIALDENSQNWLIKKGFDPVYGARALKRVVRSELLNKLATFIIDGKISPNTNVQISKNPSKEELSIDLIKKEKEKEKEKEKK
ncbi:heat shock protein 78 [Anaeramoeba ignava]|uniref:Heat shock protein 78 n=1 Tax=Anaeramoeba ignava TaxID=1746090 RepID=A0A9Q0LJN9_ANAIG|nr:heat shock protein 78 [Anaeramoeba ignava]